MFFTLKYRIKKIEFWGISIPPIYIAQYRFLGIWISIKENLSGSFSKSQRCYNETVTAAMNRIDMHKLNMDRASHWQSKKSNIIWQS